MSIQLANDQVYIEPSYGMGMVGAYFSSLNVNGYAFAGPTSGYYNLDFDGSGGAGSGGSYDFRSYVISTYPNNGENFLYDPNNYNGLGAGALAIGGTLYQNWYSDAKYKDNITPIANALDKVNAMRGVEFDWNALANEEQGRTGHDIGVIAQEVQAVYPIAVREVDKEREDHVVTALVVDYEKLIPLLLQSIKELSAEVNSLKQQVNGTNI